jgi:hypothetical protein
MISVLRLQSRQLLSRRDILYNNHRPLLVPFSTQSFFGHSSRRSQRRRRRQEKRSKKQTKGELLAEENGQDTRTVKDLLFPVPDFGDDQDDIPKLIYPTTFSGWRNAFSMTIKEYLSTWEGFFTSKGFLVEDTPTEPVDIEAAKQKANEVTDNVKRNAKFARDESLKFREVVREKTGIQSQDDVRRVTADMMQLASDCVKDFMGGYRKGRDDETEKMLTEYFKSLEVEADKPKRRRTKRRVLGRKFQLNPP